MVGKSDAARELLRRRHGRGSLLGYANAIDIPGKPVDDEGESWIFQPIETSMAAHHVLLLQAVERAMQKRYGRLMVFLPPGSAKSTYCSVVAPTWFMGKVPGSKIILASYGSDLARRHGRRARQIVRSRKFQSLYGCSISADTSAADEWSLTNGSEYIAAGLLSGITGNRAHGIVVDDPVKGREQAESETIRKKTWEAYNDDLLTRLIPGGWVIIIQTRWHMDDLAGRLLPKWYNGESGPIACNDGKVWEILNLPAMCERSDDPLGRAIGGYLWPEWFDEQHWATFRKNVRTWASLFQQRPTPGDGDIFKLEWWKYYRESPKNRWLLQSWDTGYKTGPKNAYSCCETWGVTETGYYLLDLWREKVEYPDLKRAVKAQYAKWRPRVVLVEDKASGQSLVQDLKRGTTLPIKEVPVKDGDKTARASMVSPTVEAGNVYLPEDAPWLADFLDEHSHFPNSVYKDQVDTTSMALTYLSEKSGRVISGARIIS